MSMKKIFLNPNGLNGLLSEILGETVTGEFDAGIPNHHYAGKFLREDVPRLLPGKIGSEWGAMMESSASSYMEEKLKQKGWAVKRNCILGGVAELDLVAWNGKPEGRPDLHVEIYFPQPQEPGTEYDISEKVHHDFRKLTSIDAKRKCMIIGVSHIEDKLMFEEPKEIGVEIRLQKHKFEKLKVERNNLRKDGAPPPLSYVVDKDENSHT